MHTNLPNLLTYGRIAAIPVFVGAFWLTGDIANWIALAIFIIAGITDYLDGYFARVWAQHTSLGQMLDPIADKLLVAAALLMLVAVDRIGGWTVLPAIVILSRELLVSGLREFLAGVRVSVPVTQLAKWKTTVQMVAIGFLLAGDAGDKILPITTDIGIWGLWIAAILTLYTGYDYLRAGFRHVNETPSVTPGAPESPVADKKRETV